MERKIDWVIHYVANGAVCEKPTSLFCGFWPYYAGLHDQVKNFLKNLSPFLSQLIGSISLEKSDCKT